MWLTFSKWLVDIPIRDPLQKRQAGLFQVIILIFIVGSLTGYSIALFFSPSHQTLLAARIAYPILFICNILSFGLLRLGRLHSAVYCSVLSLVIAISLALVTSGFRNSTNALLAYAIPIILAGFLLGRSGIWVTVGASAACLIGIGVLQQIAPSMVGFGANAPMEPQNLIPPALLIFVIIGFMIDRFGQLLRDVLQESISREQELSQSQSALQERTRALEMEIEARQRAEVALRQSEERYRVITEHSQDLISLQDMDNSHKLIYVSPSHLSVLGYRPDQLLGASSIELIHPNDLSVLASAWEQMLNKGVANLPHRVRHQNGSWRWLDTTMSVFSQGDQRLVLFVSRDVTEQRTLEDQIRQIQRLESVGQLAGGIAHDFNNLLTAIICNTDLILDALPTPHPIRADLEEILQASDRATALTRQLLAFARKQMIEPRLINMHQLVLETKKLLERLIGEHIQLITHSSGMLWSVRADPNQIEQVLVNLVVNARDAMSHGGTITIETCNLELDDVYAQQHLETKPGHYVLLTVSDTGKGIALEHQKRIFDPFFTTKEPGSGTGLGLATCYGIVKQHGGSIWFYSEEGHGTTFKVYLPRSEGKASPTLQPASRRTLSHGHEHILLAEDEPALRTLIARVLRTQGYTVIEASSGDMALHIAQNWNGPPIDLLISDMVMPRMGGTALSSQLLLWFPHIRQLFISGYTDYTLLQQGKLQNQTLFLQKPFSPSVLLEKVREALDIA